MEYVLAFIFATIVTVCVVMFKHNAELYRALVKARAVIHNQDEIIELQGKKIKILEDEDD